MMGDSVDLSFCFHWRSRLGKASHLPVICLYGAPFSSQQHPRHNRNVTVPFLTCHDCEGNAQQEHKQTSPGYGRCVWGFICGESDLHGSVCVYEESDWFRASKPNGRVWSPPIQPPPPHTHTLCSRENGIRWRKREGRIRIVMSLLHNSFTFMLYIRSSSSPYESFGIFVGKRTRLICVQCTSLFVRRVYFVIVFVVLLWRGWMKSFWPPSLPPLTWTWGNYKSLDL